MQTTGGRKAIPEWLSPLTNSSTQLATSGFVNRNGRRLPPEPTLGERRRENVRNRSRRHSLRVRRLPKLPRHRMAGT